MLCRPGIVLLCSVTGRALKFWYKIKPIGKESGLAPGAWFFAREKRKAFRCFNLLQ